MEGTGGLRVAEIRQIDSRGLVYVHLSDLSVRRTFLYVLESAGVTAGSEWRPEYDRAPLVLRVR